MVFVILFFFFFFKFVLLTFILLAIIPTRTQFSYGDGSFENVFQKEGKFWVDRTGFIPLLEALDAKAIVSLRPRRIGKTLFKDTLAHYYDVAQKDRFKELFSHLEIGKAPTPLANTFYVLPLTFAGLKTDTVEEFKRSLNDELNIFKARYDRFSFEKDEQNALDTFARLVGEVKTKKGKVKRKTLSVLLVHSNLFRNDVYSFSCLLTSTM